MTAQHCSTMLNALTLILLLLTPLALAAEDSSTFSPTLQPKIEALQNEKMDGKSSIGGAAIGFAGTPGLHSKSHAFFMEHATAKDLELMLSDPSPAVRIMAAHCILSKGDDQKLIAHAKKLKEDKAAIILMAGGCTASRSTVGAVIVSIEKNPKYLLN